MLLWTLGCTYFLKLLFSFSLDIYLGVESLYHMVVLFLIFWGISILFFHSGCTSFHACQQCTNVLFLHILANTCYLLSFWGWPFWLLWGCISLWFWSACPWWLFMEPQKTLKRQSNLEKKGIKLQISCSWTSD